MKKSKKPERKKGETLVQYIHRWVLGYNCGCISCRTDKK